jgi:hypothetical protein
MMKAKEQIAVVAREESDNKTRNSSMNKKEVANGSLFFLI